MELSTLVSRLDELRSLLEGNPLPLLAAGAGRLFDASPEAKTLYCDALARAWREAHARSPELGEKDRAFFEERLERERVDLTNLRDISDRLRTDLEREGFLPASVDGAALFSAAHYHFAERVSRHPDLLGPLLIAAVGEIQVFQTQHASVLATLAANLDDDQEEEIERLRERLSNLERDLPPEVAAYLDQHLNELLLGHGILQEAEVQSGGVNVQIAGDANAPIVNVTGDDSVVIALPDGAPLEVGSLGQVLRSAFARPLLTFPRLRFMQGLERPSVLLASEYEHIPFYGRERELADLLTWCGSDERFALRFYKGPGGMGKTRLARELCKRLQADVENDWQVGFLDKDAALDSHADWKELLAGGRPALVVVDYAETKREAITTLFQQVRRHFKRDPVPIRVLLLARTDAIWWQEVRARSQILGLPDQATDLTPVQDDRADAFRRAARAFAQTLEYDETPAVPEALLRRDHFARVLLIHMLALLAVHRKTAGIAEESDLLDGILSLEQDYWRKGWSGPLDEATLVGTLLRVMTLVTLGYRVPIDTNPDLFKQLGYLEGRNPTEREALAQRCIELYSGVGRFLEPLRPDILGEHLIERVLVTEPSSAARREELVALAFDTPASQPEVGIDALIRLTQRRGDEIVPVLDQILSPRLDRLALQASFAMPEQTIALRELAAKATEHATRQADSQESRAGLLNNLSNRLSDLGRREDALTAIEEAVAIYRELADARPDAFKPDLARSLNNLSVRLSDLGRREDALTASEEAVAIYRELADARPDAFKPDLARSLNNLSVRLSDLGRREDALTAIEEAVIILSPFFLHHPPAFGAWMLTMLRNYLQRCEAIGRPPNEALLTPILTVLQAMQPDENGGAG